VVGVDLDEHYIPTLGAGRLREFAAAA